MASSSASLEQWALPRLAQLLPLDDESLRQVLQYTETLPKDAAAEHLKNLLGDDAKSLEFISSFNLRRKNAAESSAPKPNAPTTAGSNANTNDAPPRRAPQNRKKKPNIYALPPRQIESRGDVAGAYQKRSEEDYMPTAARPKQQHKGQVADRLALQQPKPEPSAAASTKQIDIPPVMLTKAPPSAAGPLISDSLNSKKGKNTSSNSSTTKLKANVTGGTAMHGASTALSDLDSAIRSLELQTNPSLNDTADAAAREQARQCDCMATRHPLLDIAPNCLRCGKIICVKQGLGPCTFCGTPLLAPDELQKVLRVLKDERGAARMQANNAAHRRADVALGKARAYTGRDFLAQMSSAASSTGTSPLSSNAATPAPSDDESGGGAAAAKAKAHRDKLLNFQANNARRTTVHDEAADFDVPAAGTNMWASPVERAQQLKRQQRVLREMEWNARPEYERRRVVASIDVVGGKVVRRMAEVERPNFDVEAEEEGSHGGVAVPPETPAAGGKENAGGDGGGAFSRNPLAAGLIRPVAKQSKGKDKDTARRETRSTWRRVQMDADDNEQWILDGGMAGGASGERAQYAEEPACG